MGDFQIKSLLSVAVSGMSDISRMTMFLNQAANAGGNSARAFQSLQIASSYAAQSVTKFTDTFKTITAHALQFEETMARAAGVTNNNTLQLDAMRTVAMTLKDTVYGPIELAKALLELNRAGIEGTQALNDIKTVSDLALVTQTDLASATLSLATAFKAWGGPLDTANKLLDKFASAANTSTFEMKSLMKAMEYVQRSAIPLGVSMETSLAGLALLAPITGPNSKAGTALGGAMNRLANPRVVAELKKAGIQVYGKDGNGRRSPFEVWSDVQEYGTRKGLVAGDALRDKVYGNRNTAVAAMIARAYSEGVQYDTPDGKKTAYGRAGLKMAERNLSTGMTLAGQSEQIQNSPAGVWKLIGAQWEKLMVEVGQGFLKGFMHMKDQLITVINGLRGLNSLFGGVGLQYGAMLLGGMGLLKVGGMGLGALRSSGSMLVGGQIGPNNGAAMLAAMGGNSADALFHNIRGSQRWGYGGAFRARRQADLVSALAPVGNEDRHGVFAVSPGRMEELQRAALLAGGGPGFRGVLTPTELALLKPEERKRLENVMNRGGMLGRGRWSEWHARYGGSGLYRGAGENGTFATSAIGTGARMGWGIGSHLGPAGGLVGGGIGGLLGGVASLGSTLGSVLGPLAMFGGAIVAVTGLLERYQKAEEEQQKNVAKEKGFLNDLPTIVTGLLGMKTGGVISPDMGRLLTNNQPGSSFFATMVTNAKAYQDQNPGLGTNRALALAAANFYGERANTLGKFIGEESSTGWVDSAAKWARNTYDKFTYGAGYVRKQPMTPAEAIELQAKYQTLAQGAMASSQSVSGGIDLAPMLKSIVGPDGKLDMEKIRGLMGKNGENPFYMGTSEQFGSLSAGGIQLGSQGRLTGGDLVQSMNATLTEVAQRMARDSGLLGGSAATGLSDPIAVLKTALEQFRATLSDANAGMAKGAQEGTYAGIKAAYDAAIGAQPQGFRQPDGK